MVHCGPHEGRHTAELVADRIDQVIESLGIVGMMETQNGTTFKIKRFLKCNVTA